MHSDIIVVRDPDGYPIQMIDQDIDKHMELEEVCREVVMHGAEQAMQELELDGDPITLEEAGMKPSKPHATSPLPD